MALTVEELQIVLSCDATTAQAVLEKMDATVKAYTQKFQKYFNTMGGKGGGSKAGSGLDNVGKNATNAAKRVKDLSDSLRDMQRNEYKVGKMLSTSDISSKINENIQKGWANKDMYKNAAKEVEQIYQQMSKKKPSKDYLKQVRAGNINAENNPQWGHQGEGRMLAPSFAETFKATLASLPDLVNNFVMKSTDALSKVGSVIGKTFAVGANVAIGAVRMIGTVAETTARAIGRAFKGVVSLIRGMVGAAQKVGNAIKRAFNHTLLGKFLKRLGTVMMRMAAMKLIRGTIDGAKKGLEELAKTSASSAKAMNTIKAAGGSIKMALGAALMPIVKALAPLFVKLAGAISAAGNAIARFFAVVTGQSTYTAVNFSGALDDVSESAGGAGKAVKGMLADFDELNVLQKNSGGGGGGGSGVEQSLSTVADQNAFSELGEIIRNSILHGDWSGAATAITDKLNALIRDIPWGDIGTRIGTYLDGALEFLATAITTFDWNGLGASLAEACNAAIVRVNWANLGTVLSAKFSIVIRSLGSFLENLNFAELADGFSKFAIGFFDGITNAIESVDWKKIGENVKTFLKNVNWSGIADSIMEGIGAALGGLAALIWGLIEEAWDNVVKWWKDVAYEDGQFTISGLLDGIVKALSSIGTWIKEHIFKPIVDGFKKAFGIASPAKEMNEPGKMVGEGILEGFANAFKSIVTWLDENIFTPLVNGIEEGAKAVWAWLETAVSNVGLFFDKVKAALGIGVEYVVAFFKTIVDTITAKADVIKLSAEKIVANIKTAVLQKLKDLVDALNDGPVGKLLKAIGVDLTNASASLGKKIDESKQKSQQLDSAIQDAQATAAKGFDIEANVNQEKVAKFKETLKTPYSAYVKPGIKTEDLNAYKKNISTNVTQTRNTNVKPILADVSVYEGDVKKKVTNPRSTKVSPYVGGDYNYNATMAKNVTNARSTKVSPYIGGDYKYNENMAKSVTNARSTKVSPYVGGDYNYNDNMAKTVTNARSVKVSPQANVTKWYTDTVANATKDRSLSVTPTVAGEPAYTQKVANLVKGKGLPVTPSLTNMGTYNTAVNSATSTRTLTVNAKLNADKTQFNNAISNAMKGASAKVSLTLGNTTISSGTMKTYAQGGLAYGLTSAIIGEYAGARSNPEVVAPLNTLQGILERSNMGGNKDTMTREQANTMIGLLKELTKKETVVRPSVELGQVVDRSLKAYART